MISAGNLAENGSVPANAVFESVTSSSFIGPNAGTADFQTGIRVTAATGVLSNNYLSRDGASMVATDGTKISVY